MSSDPDPIIWWRRPAVVDAAVCLAYVAIAGWIFHGLWPHPSTRAIGANVNDQALIEWFLGHGVLVWTGDFDLHTHRLNVPDGVNLMSNASHILHGVIMTPVTVLFGPAVSFAILAVVNLAATAAGWYLLFARGLGLHRAGAFLGGLLTGFAPGMIAQSNSHLHMTAQWLVPPIVWCVIRMARAGERQEPRPLVVSSLGLAALVSAQVFLGEEVLYFTALTLLLFTIAYAASRPRWVREVGPRFLGGMALAVGAATVVLAYPLWMQIAGPLHIPNAPFAGAWFYADVASYVNFSPLSIAGGEEAGRLSSGPSELNTYLGVPLLLVVVACLVFGIIRWPRRRPVLIGVAAASIVITWLSFGPYVTVNGERTGFPSLYNLIADLPLIDGALPTRYALALLPLVALVLAITIDESLRTPGVLRIAAPVLAVLAIVPLIPAPLATTGRMPVPLFISEGGWRECVPDGGVLIPVPLPTPQQPDTMRWAAEANAAFALPEGFFIGPYGANGRASIGTFPRTTSRLLADVARTGTVPEITDRERDIARQDLAFWGADCVALAHVLNEQALRATLDALLGPGTPILDTWTWQP